MMHIRKQLIKARGNQFYRDKSNRGNGNLCGSPETSYDIPWKDRNKAKDYEIAGRTVCPICLDKKEVVN